MCTSCAYDISKDSSGSLNESQYPGSYPVPEKRIDNPAASLRKVCISLPVFCLCVFSPSRPVERFVGVLTPQVGRALVVDHARRQRAVVRWGGAE